MLNLRILKRTLVSSLSQKASNKSREYATSGKCQGMPLIGSLRTEIFCAAKLMHSLVFLRLVDALTLLL